MSPRYHHRVLQTGSLPLRPDQRIERVEHRCTSMLVWPAGETLTPDNCVATDPCFTSNGTHQAQAVLDQLALPLEDLHFYFQTHAHHDHFPLVPRGWTIPWWEEMPLPHPTFPGLNRVPCPGHSEDLHALTFQNEAGEHVWIVGDAILDRDWLLAWGYYWPNRYEPEEIVQTWRSVGKILSTADVIVPGHGEPIRVDPDLLRALLARYDRAEWGERCPEVPAALAERVGLLEL